MNTCGEYEWRIRASECDAAGLAKLPAILNLLQEAASLNAEELGFSKSDFASAGENISWVLTHLRIRMERYPRWGERIRVVTWPRKGRKITALRDFEIYDADAARIGAATSEWMVIDLATRRVMPIPDGVFEKANDERSPVFGADGFAKLRWDCRQTPDDALRFRASRNDIDLNGHVNNVHYVEWFLETLPPGMEHCAECQIAFKSETLAGEEVLAEGVETEPGVFVHRVSSPDGRDHVLAQTQREARGNEKFSKYPLARRNGNMV